VILCLGRKNVIELSGILSRLTTTNADSASLHFEINGACSMGGFIATARNALPRVVGFFVFWLILCGTKPADLVVGALTVIAATWVSLLLLPVGEWSLGVVALARLILHFPLQSLTAGIDVAWRAFDRRLPLRPGFVVYRSRLAPGTARNAFTTLTSLLPGTLPCGSDDSGGLVIHCLDMDHPVIEQLGAEEALLLEVMGGGRGDG
jgi:multicomponent Na+:H+ antiporter subunit E